MSIASIPFLFLFLPIAIGIYYLLPQRRNLLFKNVFLVLVSLLFYALGEPYFIFLFLILILLSWLLGRMANNQNTTLGKFAVFLVVVMNIGVLLTLSNIGMLLDDRWGAAGRKLYFLQNSIPLVYCTPLISRLN